MTSRIGEALVAAESAGQVLDIDDFGSIDQLSDEVVALAGSPLAPLAAIALASAVDTALNPWEATASAFAAKLGEQTSYLALQDTLDALLNTPALANAVASTLYSTLLTAHDRYAREFPYLAAARLEGALRVALADAASPYLVLHHLVSVASDMPDEYLEALPRLIGIALDRWDTDKALTEPLTAELHSLRANDAAAAGAAYELACHRLRAALRETDAAAASDGLAAAAEEFVGATALDGARDDAMAYATVCSAVAAFASGDTLRLQEATATLDMVMRRRSAWHRHMHQPAWRQPVLDAEVEWLGLVIDLQGAAERLAERSWLETAAAVGQLARAYTAERATSPAPGLSAVVRPAIENGLAANAILLDQLARAITADRDRDRRALPASADLLLEAIREHGREGHRRGSTVDDGADEEGDPRVDNRIDRLVPRLRRLLGDANARLLASRANDDQLAEIGSMLAAATASGVLDHPVLGRMRAGIIDDLGSNPMFEGDSAAVVIALVDTTLTFLLDRYDRASPVIPGLPDILRPLSRGQQPPHEKELQAQYYAWVSNSHQFAGRAQLEVSDVATGRIDVVVRLGDIKVVTEVKRELDDASRPSLERQYVAQAGAYSGSNVPFSQLLVLDLTDHTSGVPSLSDLSWVIEHRPRPDASPRHVVAAVVIGNRPPPSGLKSRQNRDD